MCGFFFEDIGKKNRPKFSHDFPDPDIGASDMDIGSEPAWNFSGKALGLGHRHIRGDRRHFRSVPASATKPRTMTNNKHYTVTPGFGLPSISPASKPEIESSESRIEEWYRLPHPRGGRLFGLSRTTLTELGQAGEIKTVLLRKRGALRGIRLIHGPSLQEYLLGKLEVEAPPGPSMKTKLQGGGA